MLQFLGNDAQQLIKSSVRMNLIMLRLTKFLRTNSRHLIYRQFPWHICISLLTASDRVILPRTFQIYTSSSLWLNIRLLYYSFCMFWKPWCHLINLHRIYRGQLIHRANCLPLPFTVLSTYIVNIINSTRLVSSDIFKENADYLCNKARQFVFAMMNKIKNLNVPAPTVLHLYQTMIQPVLVYGSDVWGVTKRGPTEADKVFNWFLR